MANPSADYPTAIHTNTDISAFSGDTLGGSPTSHTGVHGKIEEELTAIDTKLGIGASPAASAATGQILTKQSDGSTQWADPSGAVDSVFGRTGVVTASSGDYTASQITNTPAGNIASTNVQSALNELDTEKYAASNPSGFISDLTGLTTDNLTEGATNLYSQWAENTYNSTLWLQPKTITDGLIIGQNPDISLFGAFGDISAIFNGNLSGNLGLTFYGVFGYGSSLIPLGGSYISGNATGTATAPAILASNGYMGAHVFTAFDGTNWALGNDNHTLPGLYGAAIGQPTGGQVDGHYFLGSALYKMLGFRSDTNNVYLNFNNLTATTTIGSAAGTAVTVDGTSGIASVPFGVKTIALTESVADATSITPDGDNYTITNQTNTQSAGTLTINAITGTPTDGQEHQIIIKSTNAQTFSFNSGYVGSTDTPLPIATYAGSTICFMKFQYSTINSKWNILAVSDGYA